MDGSAGVWILGGYQSNLARNLAEESRLRHKLDRTADDSCVLQLTLNDVGLTGPGESWKAGVRMLLDAAKQVSSTATTVSFVVSQPEGS